MLREKLFFITVYHLVHRFLRTCFLIQVDDLPGIQAFQLRHANVVVICTEGHTLEELRRCYLLSSALHSVSSVPLIVLSFDLNPGTGVVLSTACNAAGFVHWKGSKSASTLSRAVVLAFNKYCVFLSR